MVSIKLTSVADVFRTAGRGKIGTQNAGAEGVYDSGSALRVNGLVYVKVNFKSGEDGYVLKSLLTAKAATNTQTDSEKEETTSEKPTTTNDRKVALTDNVRVRKAPGGDILTVRTSGEAGIVNSDIPAVEKDGYRWVYIDFASGADGYVAESFVKNQVTTTSNSNVQKQIADLLEKIKVLQELLAKMKQS